MNETDKKRDTIKNFRLLDNVFMRACLSDNVEAVEHILRVIMEKPNLKVVELTVQKDVDNKVDRTVVANVVAVDDTGKIYIIEIDNGEEWSKRMDDHLSLLNTNVLNSGKDIPDFYLISILDKSPYPSERPVYPISHYVEADGEMIPLETGRYGILVNGSYQGDDEIGKLMHDFRATDADEMYSPILAETVRHYKEDKAGREKLKKMMNDVLLESGKEG